MYQMLEEETVTTVKDPEVAELEDPPEEEVDAVEDPSRLSQVTIRRCWYR